jgi:hypothetical protein
MENNSKTSMNSLDQELEENYQKWREFLIHDKNSVEEYIAERIAYEDSLEENLALYRIEYEKLPILQGRTETRNAIRSSLIKGNSADARLEILLNYVSANQRLGIPTLERVVTQTFGLHNLRSEGELAFTKEQIYALLSKAKDIEYRDDLPRGETNFNFHTWKYEGPMRPITADDFMGTGNIIYGTDFLHSFAREITDATKPAGLYDWQCKISAKQRLKEYREEERQQRRVLPLDLSQLPTCTQILAHHQKDLLDAYYATGEITQCFTDKQYAQKIRIMDACIEEVRKLDWKNPKDLIRIKELSQLYNDTHFGKKD